MSLFKTFTLTFIIFVCGFYCKQKLYFLSQFGEEKQPATLIITPGLTKRPRVFRLISNCMRKILKSASQQPRGPV